MMTEVNGWFIGRPIDQIWNYRVVGVWQLDQAAEASKYVQFPGDFHIEDTTTSMENTMMKTRCF